MAVIFDDDFRMLVLDHLGELAEHGWLTDACHILQADFRRTSFDELVGDIGIIFSCMDWRGGDAERGLRSHASFEGIVDGRNDASNVVQTTEDARDVDTLGMLHLIHESAHVSRHGEHAQRVQAAVEHVGFDAHFVEWLREGTHGLVGVLTIKEIHLFKSAAVCFHVGQSNPS